MSLALAVALAAGTTMAQGTPLQMDATRAQAEQEQGADVQNVAIGRDEGDRMTVAVTVGGQGPYRFLVDTGSERTVISRQLASRLRLGSGERMNLHSVAGVDAVETVNIRDLKVSSNTISVADAPALEASNIGADGMLGVDSLRSQRVTFDFKAKTMAITSSRRSVERPDPDTIVVTAKNRKGRLIFTDAYIDRQRVTIIVDTGSQVTIGNPALESSLRRRRSFDGVRDVTVESVTGSTLSAKVARLEKLEVGGLHINDLAVAFADAHIFDQLDLKRRPALLLGMNALRAFDRITIDFAARKVRFRLPGTSMREAYRLAMVTR